jgi:hypothetical protein
VKFHNEEAEALKQRITVRDEDDEDKEKVTAFQLRTLKRCSLARINCSNLQKIITRKCRCGNGPLSF